MTQNVNLRLWNAPRIQSPWEQFARFSRASLTCPACHKRRTARHLRKAKIHLRIGKVHLRDAKVHLRTGKIDLRKGKIHLRTGKTHLLNGKIHLRSGKIHLRKGKIHLRNGLYWRFFCEFDPRGDLCIVFGSISPIASSPKRVCLPGFVCPQGAESNRVLLVLRFFSYCSFCLASLLVDCISSRIQTTDTVASPSVFLSKFDGLDRSIHRYFCHSNEFQYDRLPRQ